MMWYKKRILNINENTEEPNEGVKNLDKNCEDLEVYSESKTELTVRQLEDIHVDIDNITGQEYMLNTEYSKTIQKQHDIGTNLFTRIKDNTDEIKAVSNIKDSSNYRIDRKEWKFDLKSGRFKLKKKEYYDIEKLIGIPEDILAVYDIGIRYLAESQIYIENSKSENSDIKEVELISSDPSLKVEEHDARVYTDSDISTIPYKKITIHDTIQETEKEDEVIDYKT